MASQTDAARGFKDIVESLGLTLSKEGEPNQLDGEPALFKHRLLMVFDRTDLEEFAEEFIEGMFEYFNNYRCFRACLMPTILTNNCNELSLLAPKESLFRYILGIGSLQEKITEVLITKLIDVTSQEDRCDFDTAKTIINQFRWLEQIVDPSDLLEKLTELIGISPLDVQQEIIAALPDIFVEVDHSDLLEKLIALAQDSNDLFVPVIECLGNINIPSAEIARVNELILNRLDSIDLDSLAVAVHFLLLTGTEDSIYTTLTSIRTKIDLDHFRRMKRAEKALQKGKTTSPSSYESLLLDKLEKILVSSGPVKAAWVKLFEELRSDDRLHSLDILVLVILHSMNDTKKKVEQLFKTKILSGLLKKEFLAQTIIKFLPLIEKKTMELLGIAEFLLRNSQTHESLGEVASAIFCAIFQKADIYHRQEVVGALITHVGSGNAWEIHHALNALDGITRKDPQGMLRFAIFVKGILDYLDRLTLDQVARLFVIYTILALEEGAEPGDSGLKNDLHMIIRKQLSHPSEKYKSIGITSSLAMVKQMSHQYASTINDPRYSCGSSSDTTNRHPILEQAISMLQLLQAACHKSMASLPIAYNNLAQMILKDELHADLVRWIFDHIVVLFADLFVIETDVEMAPVHPPSWPESFQLEVWDDLNEGSVAVAINILPTVIRHFYNNQKSYHPNFICALFNLYQSCEKFISKSLEELDALLGCGIVMFNKDILGFITRGDKGDMPDCLILAMIVALNWYRELINAFHTNVDASLLLKVKERVGHLAKVEELLSEFSVHPHHLSGLHVLDAPRKKSQQATGLSITEIRTSLSKLAPTTYELIQRGDVLDPETDSLMEMRVDHNMFLLANLKDRLEEPAYRDFIRRKETLPGMSSLLKIFIDESCRQCEQVDEVSSQEGALLLECILKVVESYPLLSEVSSDPIYNDSMMLLDAFNSISDASSLLLDLHTSILLEKVLSGIAKRIPRDERITARLRILNQSLLSRSWGSVLKKEHITYLVNEEFTYTAEPKAVLEAYINQLLLPFSSQQDYDFSSTYPNFSRLMFPTFYAVISKQLLAIASTPFQGGAEVFSFIKSISSQWQSLVKAATVMDSDRTILLTVLRTGRSFVDIFSRTMLPIMDAYLHSNRAIVLSIFKSVQQGTRKLQNICDVTKTSKDKALTAAIPPCRSKMETFVLQVKKLFKDNNILEAYSIGALKHRDMAGQVISSQIPVSEIISQNSIPSEDGATQDDTIEVSREAPKGPKKGQRKRHRGTMIANSERSKKNRPSSLADLNEEENEDVPVSLHSD